MEELNIPHFLKSVVFFLIATILLAVGALQLGTIGSFGVTTTHWISWILVTLIVASGFLTTLYSGSFKIPFIMPYIFIYLILVVFAAFYAPAFNPDVMWEWYGFLAGITLFWSLHQVDIGDRWEGRIYWLIVISGLIQALLGLAQLKSISLLGYTFNPKSAVGGFYQANNYATYLAVTALASMTLKNWGSRWQAALLRVVALAILILVTYMLSISGSRTGLLGMGIGFILIAYGRFRGRYAQMEYLLPSWSWLLAAVIGYALPMVIFSTGGNAIFKFQVLSNYQAVPRFAFYQASWDVFNANLITGSGLGTFTSLFQQAYVTVMGQLGLTSILDSVTFHPHNETLYRFFESGLLGGVGFILMGVMFIFGLRKFENHFGWVYAGALIPLALHTQTEYPFYHSPLSWVLFLVLLYLPSRHLSWSFMVSSWKLERWGPALVVIIASAALLTSFWLGEKAALASRVQQAFYLSKNKNANKVAAPQIVRNAFKDSYFAGLVKRMLLFNQVGWVQKNSDRTKLRDYMNKLNEAYRYFPPAPYYHIKALTHASLNEFSLAFSTLGQAEKLYPKYSAKTSTKRSVMHRGVLHAMKHRDRVESSVMIKRYLAWIKGKRDRVEMITDKSYGLLVWVLYEQGRKKEAVSVLKHAKKLYPDSKAFSRWKIKKKDD